MKNPSREMNRLELYDLSADPGETKNLASSRPEIVQRLSQRLEQLLAF